MQNITYPIVCQTADQALEIIGHAQQSGLQLTVTPAGDIRSLPGEEKPLLSLPGIRMLFVQFCRFLGLYKENYERIADAVLKKMETEVESARAWVNSRLPETSLQSIRKDISRGNFERASLVWSQVKQAKEKAENAPILLEQEKSGDKPLTEAKLEHEVMKTYGVPFDEADAIVALACSPTDDPELLALSQSQRLEIAWLRLNTELTPKEALLSSVLAGPLSGQNLVRRDALLMRTQSEVLAKLNETIDPALPAAWPHGWQAMPDGSRRLVDTKMFTEHFMDFLNDSLKDCKFDGSTGLAQKFLDDAGRTHFRFGEGREAVTADCNFREATETLSNFIPDPEVRRFLSAALFQTGGNGLTSALHNTLPRPGKPLFSILSLDAENDQQKASANFWISLQKADDEKLRVGYTVYWKHFTLIDMDSNVDFKINRSYQSNTPASKHDHTARATAVVEFDADELRRGVINPRLARPAELTMSITPDYGSLMEAMIRQSIARFG